LAKDICNYKKSQSLYQIFTVVELDQIEKEALEIRRKHCQRQSAAVDQGLYKKAVSGDPTAAKLWYQRMEGWSEKKQHEFPGGEGNPQSETPVVLQVNFVDVENGKPKIITPDFDLSKLTIEELNVLEKLLVSQVSELSKN
jgi:hypothetical protein